MQSDMHTCDFICVSRQKAEDCYCSDGCDETCCNAEPPDNTITSSRCPFACRAADILLHHESIPSVGGAAASRTAKTTQKLHKMEIWIPAKYLSVVDPSVKCRHNHPAAGVN